MSSASSNLIASAELISQGAEAVNVPLSEGEARALLKCLRAGVNVPGIRMVDATEGILGIEWIEGTCVRKLLPGAEAETELSDADTAPFTGVDALMGLIGTEIAKMHLADIIHGDLTTSNMILESSQSLRLVLIDFGLSYHSGLVEDKAVDLYVLERAFASTHPDSEPMFSSVLKAYEVRMGKHWTSVSKRLDDVRLRGRKRSMRRREMFTADFGQLMLPIHALQ
ncbi:serine/threonine-protein kinase bud32 [Pleurotus pulmonarius]|nr:serine/threonine-protein kinase bud32 [Pleurotus pulmonarius]